MDTINTENTKTEELKKPYVVLRAAEGVIIGLTNTFLGTSTRTTCERSCAVYWYEESPTKAAKKEEEEKIPQAESSASIHLEMVIYNKGEGAKLVSTQETGMLSSFLYDTLDYSRKNGILWGAMVVDLEPGIPTSVYYYPKKVSEFLPDWTHRLDKALTNPTVYSELIQLDTLLSE